MDNHAITSAEIIPVLSGITNYEYILANEARSGGYSICDDPDIEELLTEGYRHARTTQTLDGRVRSLAAHTLVRYETLTLPVQISQQSIEDLIYRRQVETISFERIQVTEPCRDRPTQFNHVGYFNREQDDVHVVVEGLSRVLNDPEDAFLDKDEVHEQLRAVLKVYEQIQYDEQQIITSVIDNLFPAAPRD